MKTSAKKRASNAAWKARNKERISEMGRAYYTENKESCKAKVKARADTMRPELAAASSQWRKDNRGTCNAYNGAYRAALLQQTPIWSETAKIRQLYQHCYFLSEITGEPHEIDHIVPLQGKKVRGFHVWDNLQILPKRIHKHKGNKHASR